MAHEKLKELNEVHAKRDLAARPLPGPPPSIGALPGPPPREANGTHPAPRSGSVCKACGCVHTNMLCSSLQQWQVKARAEHISTCSCLSAAPSLHNSCMTAGREAERPRDRDRDRDRRSSDHDRSGPAQHASICCC